jgi:hypothetical protein
MSPHFLPVFTQRGGMGSKVQVNAFSVAACLLCRLCQWQCFSTASILH